MRVFSSPKQGQFPQPFFIVVVLQPSDRHHGPPLDTLQQFHIFPVLVSPGLKAVFQMRSHEGRVEGGNPLPLPAGHHSFDEAQDMVGLSSCKHMLTAHIQLSIHQNPQILLLRFLQERRGLQVPLFLSIDTREKSFWFSVFMTGQKTLIQPGALVGRWAQVSNLSWQRYTQQIKGIDYLTLLSIS